MEFRQFFESFFGVEMTPMYIASQVVSLFSSLCFVASYQSKQQKKIMIWQLAAGLLSVLCFLLQHAYTGMLLSFVSVLRALLFMNVQDKKWASSIFIPIGLSVLCVIGAAFTWAGWESLFPLIAQVVLAFAHRFKNPRTVRLLSLPGDSCWLVYNILVGNVVGIFTEIFIVISIIVGLLRHDVRRKSSEKAE